VKNSKTAPEPTINNRPLSVKSPIRSLFLVTLFLPLVFWAASASAQIVNFKPLERGEYTEEEEKLTVLRGLDASLDYAAILDRAKFDRLTSDEEKTDFSQDFRLNLRSVFHRDVELFLSLEPTERSFEASESRQRKEEEGRLSDSQAISLNLREAYLRYRFNPRSALIVGKQEISIGDRRGKVFNGIAPAITYDCNVGTWCMPFGAIKVGQLPSDWIFHWALEYTAWDNKNNGYDNDTFKVEIFRILYSENNIPLGKNHGPAFYNPDNPDNGTQADSSQATDSAGNPIYYDADSQDYFGVRLGWDSGAFFLNFDFTINQGDRRLRRYSDENTSGVQGLTFGSTEAGEFSVSLSGKVWESEIGFRGPKWRTGLRVLSADGDSIVDPTDKSDYLIGTTGYHEITPGTYRGTRLYFNGTDKSVEQGSGLGHSISNIFLVGVFYEFSDPGGQGLDYQLGVYKLELNNPIEDGFGNKQSNIGVEINNLLSFYIHKAIKWQFEINILDTQGAFTLSDYSRPFGQNTSTYAQGVTRLIYKF
jgi:hypothetical protein